jgi:hypothetical protein
MIRGIQKWTHKENRLTTEELLEAMFFSLWSNLQESEARMNVLARTSSNLPD